VDRAKRTRNPIAKLAHRLWRPFNWRLRHALASLGATRRYSVGEFEIALSIDHMLPEYQRSHPLYDRFLPHLAAHLPRDATIVDVGANCGDTLAALASVQPAARYLCIEPDATFFKLLEANIRVIESHLPTANIFAVKALVGRSVGSATLVGTDGSKHAVVGTDGDGLRTRSLDSIFAESRLTDLTLLKSDVDGFDYDVLDSAEVLLREQSPILFFECQYEHAFQKDGFDRLVMRLAEIGYRQWTLFDKFGAKAFTTENVADVQQLFSYVWIQNQGKSTRTINYFDLLAVGNRHYENVAAALNSY
jgi:FkbM family methyltransferase